MIGRFFTRALALILALTVFVLTLWFAFSLEPEGPAGWGVWAGLVVAGALGAFVIYRLMLHAGGIGTRYHERTGAGMMLGMGYESNRRNWEDDELD
ncbi:hypothetical protein [Alkalicaulis satelles]|nr:hypothetical protein [Alkalicaulis satelles]